MKHTPGNPDTSMKDVPSQTMQQVLEEYEEEVGKSWSKFTPEDEVEVASRFFEKNEVAMEDLHDPLTLSLFFTSGGEKRCGVHA